MNCKPGETVRGLLAQNGKPASESYAHAVADVAQDLMIFGNYNTSDRQREQMAAGIKAKLEAHPTLRYDLEGMEDLMKEAYQGLRKYLEGGYDGEYDDWGVSGLGQNGYKARLENGREVRVYYEEDELAGLGEDYGYRKGSQMAVEGIGYNVNFSQNSALFELASLTRKSLAEHLDLERGDGVIPHHLEDNIEQMRSLVELLEKNPSHLRKATLKPLVSHYRQIADQLRLCASSAALGKGQWQQPQAVEPYYEDGIFESFNRMPIPSIPKKIIAGAKAGDMRMKGFVQGYKRAVRDYLRKASVFAFPAARQDLRMAELLDGAAASLGTHATTGTLDPGVVAAVSEAKAIYNSIKDDDAQFGGKSWVQAGFAHHYQQVFEDFDACIAEMPQKTGRVPAPFDGLIEDSLKLQYSEYYD